MGKKEKIELSDSTPLKIISKEFEGKIFAILNNNSDGYIYVGKENVSPNDYFQKIDPDYTASFFSPLKEDVYAISSSPDMFAVLFTSFD